MKNKTERGEIFKVLQSKIKKQDTFVEGKESLLALRKELSLIYDYIFHICGPDDFLEMPAKSDKTVAYYFYHLMRIEDIVTNTLIKGKGQVFFAKGFQNLLNSPIVTTGNEIQRDDLVEFSKSLNLGQLKVYTDKVWESTNTLIQNMTFDNSKTKVTEERKAKLLATGSVSEEQSAFWLMDYWCKKTYGGLLLMPLSRHHMMHLDGCLRIIRKLKNDPTASKLLSR